MKVFDRHFWLAIALAAIVLFPRSWMITRSQSERIDDEYHMQRGIAFLNRAMGGDLRLNDPPVGQAIEVLPLWLAHCWPRGVQVESALWGNRFSPDTILNVVGLWKTLLFLPFVGLAFVWARQIYGLSAAWAAAVLLIIEPSFAEHMVVGALDVMGIEAIGFACYFAWRYFQQPSLKRLIIASVIVGIAMMIKHTAVILPGILVIFAGMWWVVKPWFDRRRTRNGEKGVILINRQPKNQDDPFIGQTAGLPKNQDDPLFGRLRHVLLAAVIVPFTMWALILFDVSRPVLPNMPKVHNKKVHWGKYHPTLARLLDRPLPGGMYVSCWLEAQTVTQFGHWGYLFGERRQTGWWYYFPVVATYKVPIGIFVLMLMAIVSLKWNRFRWDEWSLLIPAIAWSALMMHATFNIGWRHFIPAYFFWMMLATRAMVGPRGWQIGAWCAIAIAGLHAMTFNPDYLCYINWPRKNAYEQISDSNIDWGQGLKDVRKWILKHPNRKVYVRDFGRGGPRGITVNHRLADVCTIAWDANNRPTHGIFIISPVPLVGVYDDGDPYRALRKYKPIAILGHCMRVYDLDKLRKKGKPFDWGPPIINASAKESVKKKTNKGARSLTARSQ